MFNPLINNLHELNDHELEEKIRELSKKIFVAHRLGNFDLLTQVETCLIMYKEERSKRYSERAKKQLDDDLDQLINVE